jgi:hypothetical protein
MAQRIEVALGARETMRKADCFGALLNRLLARI